MNDELCACGRPLHYTSPITQHYVEKMIATLGSHVPVTVQGRTWLVQRHYVALHGLKAVDLPNLGFEEVR
jgi:hypothetical protein